MEFSSWWPLITELESVISAQCSWEKTILPQLLMLLIWSRVQTNLLLPLKMEQSDFGMPMITQYMPDARLLLLAIQPALTLLKRLSSQVGLMGKSGHTESITSRYCGQLTMLISFNFKFLATGGLDGEVRIWEIRSRELISHLKEHTGKITKI